jgi:hypothetical protein
MQDVEGPLLCEKSKMLTGGQVPIQSEVEVLAPEPTGKAAAA